MNSCVESPLLRVFTPQVNPLLQVVNSVWPVEAACSFSCFWQCHRNLQNVITWLLWCCLWVYNYTFYLLSIFASRWSVCVYIFLVLKPSFYLSVHMWLVQRKVIFPSERHTLQSTYPSPGLKQISSVFIIVKIVQNKSTFNISLGCMEATEAGQSYLVYMLTKEKRCLRECDHSLLTDSQTSVFESLVS